ncbi:Sec8-exocyst domain containing protein [Pyrenophora tritici-repentis]|nr:Sec8-exocyst domain containing protein [Pyrenophora tritici-repentis]KAI1573786.1 Sec8-exocyst domain containing protein [Pyrenophora tritici-repentis]KAI1581743.1 Sec8-exocyst domain containing protein [Pyrenophora tritici-repentis]KAI1600993.1 Sec8-exocyst domain containing protein [Pyrenophora tritici-repentis]
MSRNPGYSRAGANGGYANDNGGYNGGGYNGYAPPSDPNYDGRPSGERPRRPGGYGGLNPSPDDYAPRPSNERERSRPSNDRPRRPGGYGGLAQEEEMDRRPSGERERRPTGYGGGGYAARDESPRQVMRPTSLDRSPAKRRSGERQNGRVPRSPNPGPGSQAIEEVLQYIQQKWDFMTKDQCVPIEVALKLMDSSSLGLASQAGQFQQTHDQLQNALKGIVNEHHQGFNSSIGTFHQIQSSLQSSQHRVRTLKGSLVAAKSQLSTAKPELREFATTSQNYDEMLQMLDTIEKLQLIPERLEARISEKRFLTAVDILQDALRMIRKTEMERIGALSDLRTYLSNQEVSLTDILVEELHSHLYLKSPYCEDRWKEYAQNQIKGDLSQRAQADARGRLLYYYLDGLDTSEDMTDDSAHNPESDTFQYIRLVIEALNKMNRLDLAVDTIEQRLPVELFKVVDKSNNEVAQRHPSILRAYSAKKSGKSKTEIESEDVRSTLLNDLMWTLYARFEAIAESHRVVHDVVAGILRRENRASSNTALTRGFKELWKLYQSEIRSLLHDYLATDGEASYRDGPGQTSADSAFSRAPRDRNKRMFKLSDVDTKAPELSQEREDLELILKTSVPGLVSDSKRLEEVTTNTTANLDGSATGHKLLVEPSVFNMGILLPPSLDFLNRLKEVVPSNADISMSTLTSFLDDFLVNVFHPQLDETLIELCAQTFMELDAFTEDPHWTKHSKKPIFKGTAQFFTLITAFCKMLDNLPHDQAFSQLIVNQMDTYAQKCMDWYNALVSRSKPTPSDRRLKAPAVWAESDEMEELITRLIHTDPSDRENLKQAIDKEVALLIDAVEADEPLDQADMIQDKKTIVSLCLLYTSMKWLATKTAQLRHISDRASDPNSAESNGQRHNRRWTQLASSDPRPEGAAVYLPLSAETATIFDAVVSTYKSLSNRVLRTMHLSIRATILYSLNASTQPSIYIDTLLSDPDPAILALNSTLVSFDTAVSTYIPVTSYSHITRGLAVLMDTYLFSLCTSKIERMNTNGCALMQLNILVLQQNLKNIEDGATLPYAALFFDLFTAGPDAIIARAKQYGRSFGVPGDRFGEAEVKKLLQMTYEERVNGDNREASVQAKRALDAQLLEII